MLTGVTPILWLLSNPRLVSACLIIGLNLLFFYSLEVVPDFLGVVHKFFMPANRK